MLEISRHLKWRLKCRGESQFQEGSDGSDDLILKVWIRAVVAHQSAALRDGDSVEVAKCQALDNKKYSQVIDFIQRKITVVPLE